MSVPLKGQYSKPSSTVTISSKYSCVPLCLKPSRDKISNTTVVFQLSYLLPGAVSEALQG